MTKNTWNLKLEPTQSIVFPKLNYDPIDRDHEEFVRLIQQLVFASNVEFAALFQALYQHTELHFEREFELMKQSCFPAEAEHSGDHQRVLGEFKQFNARVDKGAIDFARAFVKDRLPSWFQLHVATMNSALVAHVKKVATA